MSEYVLASPVAVKLASLEPDQITVLYKRVFEGTDGQLVLEDLRQRGCFYIPSADFESANATFFNEGRRSMVMHIETQLRQEQPQGESDHDA